MSETATPTEFSRVGSGTDAAGTPIWLEVPRVSTSGHLAGSGLGARLLGGADLVPLGRAALVASLEVTLDGYDVFASPSWLPSVHFGAGLRF